MFDTHVNLHGETYEEDLEDVLERARAAGVRRFLAICDRLDNFEAVSAITKQNDDMWCSVGVHPHHSKDFSNLATAELVQKASDLNVVAIGETGLDFHYGYSSEKEQVASLLKHIDAARETGLPLIVHTREADELMGDILEDETAKAPFTPLLHCYTGGRRLAERAAALGAYFSVSGIASFKNAKDVHDVVRSLPQERVILETDCPYLTPAPFRGRRNEPAYLVHVCEAYAALIEKSAGDVARITEANALRLFSKIAQ
ncbi:MAG: TatD family hydrolase [Pseudomonadota bacterium]